MDVSRVSRGCGCCVLWKLSICITYYSTMIGSDLEHWNMLKWKGNCIMWLNFKRVFMYSDKNFRHYYKLDGLKKEKKRVTVPSIPIILPESDETHTTQWHILRRHGGVRTWLYYKLNGLKKRGSIFPVSRYPSRSKTRRRENDRLARRGVGV